MQDCRSHCNYFRTLFYRVSACLPCKQLYVFCDSSFLFSFLPDFCCSLFFMHILFCHCMRNFICRLAPFFRLFFTAAGETGEGGGATRGRRIVRGRQYKFYGHRCAFFEGSKKFMHATKWHSLWSVRAHPLLSSPLLSIPPARPAGSCAVATVAAPAVVCVPRVSLFLLLLLLFVLFVLLLSRYLGHDQLQQQQATCQIKCSSYIVRGGRGRKAAAGSRGNSRPGPFAA